MALTPVDRPRISRRLKDALIADLVLGDLDETGDHWMDEPLPDEWVWTRHLGRQLGIETAYNPGGIHETLLLILPEVDRLIRTWPPVHDIKTCQALAHEATKHPNPPSAELAEPGRALLAEFHTMNHVSPSASRPSPGVPWTTTR